MIASNDGWIEWTWTEDKPYPESLDTMVEVMFGDGGEFASCEVGYWGVEWGEQGDCWLPNKRPSLMIVSYRVVN